MDDKDKRFKENDKPIGLTSPGCYHIGCGVYTGREGWKRYIEILDEEFSKQIKQEYLQESSHMMKKVLFLNDNNGFSSGERMSAWLVLIPKMVTGELIKINEVSNRHRGGMWEETLQKMHVPYQLVKTGRKSDFKSDDYDLEIKMSSGNY